jgi:hypothetical protein
MEETAAGDSAFRSSVIVWLITESSTSVPSRPHPYVRTVADAHSFGCSLRRRPERKVDRSQEPDRVHDICNRRVVIRGRREESS